MWKNPPSLTLFAFVTPRGGVRGQAHTSFKLTGGMRQPVLASTISQPQMSPVAGGRSDRATASTALVCFVSGVNHTMVTLLMLQEEKLGLLVSTELMVFDEEF